VDTINVVANKNTSCSTLASAFTGTLGCQIEFGTPENALITRRGFVIPKETIFDKAYIDAQTQLGNFIPALLADSFEDTSSEDTMNTNSKGVDRLSVLGLPKYVFTYQQGHGFYREVAKLTTFKNFDLIIGDESGNWKMAVNSNGDFTGFSCGQILAGMTKSKVAGGDPESKSLTFQMINRNQWDKNYVIIGREQLDFSPEDLATINPVEVALSTPAVGGLVINVKLRLASDRVTPVEGMLPANFRLMKNGVAVAGPLVITEGEPGDYALTIAAAVLNDKFVLETYDALLGTRNILLSDTLFNGVSEEIVVV
jgi:hypothetical protein